MKQSFTKSQSALDGLGAFFAVAKHMNFGRAAAELNVTASSMSQKIRKLERIVGSPLFIRTTRNVGLSEAGRKLAAEAGPAFDLLNAALAAIADLGSKPSGLLRITCPRPVVPLILQPKLASFHRLYPAIELEIVATEELLDVAQGEFDAGIRLGQLISQAMTVVRLTDPFPLVVVGSHAYLKEHGVPHAVEDLEQHACLRFRRSSGQAAPWSFNRGNRKIEVETRGPLIAHDFATLLEAAADGMGLAQIPRPLVQRSKLNNKLKMVLNKFEPNLPGVFLYYPERSQVMPKLRAFIDHLKA
jgi:DNA-binding transcriptional LysR family regulator